MLHLELKNLLLKLYIINIRASIPLTKTYNIQFYHHMKKCYYLVIILEKKLIMLLNKC